MAFEPWRGGDGRGPEAPGHAPDGCELADPRRRHDAATRDIDGDFAPALAHPGAWQTWMTRWLHAVVLALVLLPACKQEVPPPPVDPFADIVPDPAATLTRTPTAALVPYGAGRAAPDQLLVLLDAEAVEADVARALGGEIIGRLPAIGLVQLGLDAPDEGALAAAATAARGLEGVLGAAPNLGRTTSANPAVCQPDADNDELAGVARCAFEDVDWYQAAAILRGLDAVLSLSRVRVAVLDSGVHVATGQFDDVAIYPIVDAFTALNDTVGHGTGVAGLIAADDRDGQTAGLASAILHEKLQLIVGAADETAMGTLFDAVFATDRAKAELVNMSWTLRDTNYAPGDQRDLQAMYDVVFDRFPGTTFVLAAGNSGVEVADDNFVPQSTAAPNVLVVGGTQSCEPEVAATFSNHGDAVHVAAPGVDVPVIRPDGMTGGPYGDDGTSFAAPIVTALGAVLRSLAPEMSGTEVARHIRDHGVPGPGTMSGVRAHFTEAILQLLVLRQPSPGALAWIDIDDTPGQPDAPATILHRLCGGGDLEVDGLGSWDFPQDNLEGGSFLSDLGPYLFMGNDEVSLFGPVEADFEALGQPVLLPAAGNLVFTYGLTHMGTVTQGAVTVVRCAITERAPFGDDTPAIVELEVEGHGILDVLEVDTMTSDPRGFQFSMVAPAVVMATGPALQVLEDVCENGYGESAP